MTSTTPGKGPAALARLVDRVPEGWTQVTFRDRPYGLSRTTRAMGRSISVMARELGGPDVVSANIYATSQGHQLRSCEMPDRKVLDFLSGWQPARMPHAQPPSPESDEPDDLP